MSRYVKALNLLNADEFTNSFWSCCLYSLSQPILGLKGAKGEPGAPGPGFRLKGWCPYSF